MKISEYLWYDPIKKDYNIKRSQTYYVGFLSSDDDKIHEDFESKAVIDCLNHYPTVLINDFYIIQKNYDYTETVMFEWNLKYKMWFNIYNCQRKVV